MSFRNLERSASQPELYALFRGGKVLGVGDRVSFEVSVRKQDEDIPTDGTWWTLAEELATAHFMEVFFDGKPPEYRVSLWQSTNNRSTVSTARDGALEVEAGFEGLVRIYQK